MGVICAVRREREKGHPQPTKRSNQRPTEGRDFFFEIFCGQRTAYIFSRECQMSSLRRRLPHLRVSLTSTYKVRRCGRRLPVRWNNKCFSFSPLAEICEKIKQRATDAARERKEEGNGTTACVKHGVQLSALLQVTT